MPGRVLVALFADHDVVVAGGPFPWAFGSCARPSKHTRSWLSARTWLFQIALMTVSSCPQRPQSGAGAAHVAGQSTADLVPRRRKGERAEIADRAQAPTAGASKKVRESPPSQSLDQRVPMLFGQARSAPVGRDDRYVMCHDVLFARAEANARRSTSSTRAIACCSKRDSPPRRSTSSRSLSNGGDSGMR